MATTKNYLDYTGLSKYNELLKAFVAKTYVAQEANKFLMTKEQSDKLAGIDTGAQVNVIESISVKGKGDASASPLTVTGKGVTLDISAYALYSDVTAETQRASAAEATLGGRINAIFTPASEGKDASGSVVEYVASEIAKVNGAADTLAGRVTANEEAIALLNGNASTSGSVDYKVANAIAKIVNDNQNGSIDTLNEIAAWIVNDTTGAAKMANDIATLKGEETVEGSVKKALKDAKTYADGLHTTATNAIGAEKTRAEGVEKALDGRLTVVEGEGEGSIKKALQDAKTYTDGKIGTIPGPVGQTTTSTVVAYVDAKVAAEQKRASDAESALDGRLDAIEASIGTSEKSMHERVSALETTVGDSSKGLVKGVADNKAAIAAMDTAYKAADNALKAEIDAIGAIPLEGANSVASLFPAA